MKKLRLGVIGAGLAWQRLHTPALRELGDRYEVRAISDIIEDKAIKAVREWGLPREKAYSDFRNMLTMEELDVVDIVVPISQNYLISEEVARRGFSLICEKPLAPTMQQALRYRELPKSYGVRVLIAENFKYDEENNMIKEIVESGRIGDVVYFMMNNVACIPEEMMKDSYAATEWRQHPDFPGGAFLDAALHDLARVRHVFGGVDRVQAFGVPQHEDFCPYRSISVNMKFVNGVVGQYTYWPSGHELQRPLIGFRVFGTKGEVYLEDKTCGFINLALNDGQTELIRFTPERGYYNEFLNFHNALTANERIGVSPETEFGDVKMVFDILKSLKDGTVNSVDTEANPDPHPRIPSPPETSQYVH